MIEPDSAGGSDTITGGNGLSIRSHPHTPTAERALVVRLARASQAKNNPNVTVLVVPGTECIFVIIAIDSPTIAKGFENVGPAVPITILDSGNFRALGQVKPTILPCDSQDLVKPAGEKGPSGFGLFAKDALTDKDISSREAMATLFPGRMSIPLTSITSPSGKGIVVMG